MTNHIHLLAVPQRRESLARSMRRVQSDYSQRLNRRHGWRSGHLWQSRFYSCVASGDTAWTVLRYIELNPVRAHLVSRAELSPWSSAAMHCGLQTTTPLLALAAWASEWSPSRWQSVLALGEDEREFEAIGQATSHGLPYGDENFIADLERRTGRDLRRKKMGRPPTLSSSTVA